MAPAPWLSAVRASPLLSTLGDFDFETLLDVVRRRSLERGATLYRQNERGDRMVIVAEGLLEVRVATESGGDRAIATLGPGQVVGEMSCIDPGPRSATVVAKESSLVLELDPALLATLKSQAPSVVLSLYRGIIRSVTTRIRATDAQITRELGAPEARSVAPPKTSVGPRPALFKGRIDPRRIQNLDWLPPAEFDLLVSAAPPLTWPDAAVLCHEGAPGASCFLILQGNVGVFKSVGDARRRLATLGPGAFVGQMALVDRIPRSATVEAEGTVVALELARDTFERLLSSSGSLGIRFQEQIAVAGIRQLRAADQRLSTVLATARPPTSAAAPARPTGRVSAGDFFRIALKEWGVSMKDLDSFEVVRPDGIASAQEIKARRGR